MVLSGWIAVCMQSETGDSNSKKMEGKFFRVMLSENEFILRNKDVSLAAEGPP